MRPMLALLLLLALAGPALAVDGVAEINQTCAVKTGCFSGDTAGYPVTITELGSYLLTSNLIVPDENTDGIVVSTSDVGIDLNDFTIIRSGCEGVTTDCTPTSGTGSGVEVTPSSNLGVSVKNGSITGMGRSGVNLGLQSHVSDLRVRWNRVDGIFTPTGATISGNTAYQNGDDGVDAGGGSTVSGNTVYDNGGDGIHASAYSTVSGNTAFSNGGDGIDAGVGSTVQRNTLGSNAGFGLRLSSTAAYRENVITFNTTGTVSGGVNAGGNVCNGSLTCP